MSANAYLKTEVYGASKFDLHLMVVNGAIRYAKFARDSLERRDFEKAHAGLSKSRDFVASMIGGLRDEHQPELIERLTSLFRFVYERLALADFHGDPKLVADALTILESHRATMNELGAMLHSATATAAGPQSMAPPPEPNEPPEARETSARTPPASSAAPPAAGHALRGPHKPRATSGVRIFRDV